ncbi:MAG: CheY-like chemotaxis protein/signal transduction histidine kinase [Alcanivorax sp.]|jgi:CheY-like chemotaxis protein/signal transduction histidine kinase
MMHQPEKIIGIKLAMISVSLIIAILSVGVVGLNALDALNKSMNSIVDVAAFKVQLGEKIQQDLLKITRAGKNIIIAQTQEEMGRHAVYIDETYADLLQRVDLIETLEDTQAPGSISGFREKLIAYMAIDNQVRRYARMNSNVRAREISATTARLAFDHAQATLRNILSVDDRVAERYDKLAADAQLKVTHGAEIQSSMLLIMRAERNIILSTDVDEMRAYADSIELLQDNIFSNQRSLTKLTIKDDAYQLDMFSRTWQRWREVYSRVLAVTLLNSNVRAVALSTGDARSSFENLEDALINMGKFYETRFQSADVAADSTRLAYAGQIVQWTARLLRNLMEYQRAEKNLVLTHTQTAKDTYTQIMLDLEVEIDRRFEKLQARLEADGEDMDLFRESKRAYKNYRAHNTEVRRLARENGNRRAFDLATGEGRLLADQAELQLEIVVKENIARHIENTRLLALVNDRKLLVARMVQDMLAIHRAEKNLILEKTQVGMDGFSDSLAIYKSDLQDKIKRLKILSRDDELINLEDFEQSWFTFLAVNEQVRELSRQNSNRRAFDLAAGAGRELADQAEEMISKLVTDNEQSMDAERVSGNRVFDENLFLILSTLLLSTVLGSVFSFFVIRNILAVIINSAQENKRSQWIKTGQAEIADSMAGGKALEELSRSIVTALVKYLGGSVGVIYLVNYDNTYSQAGSYAVSHDKPTSKTFKVGEGTVGQAILDADTIIISELPDDYITIHSGLGEAVPRHLLVMPIKFGGSVTGAIEIGSFVPFTNLQVEFAELVSNSIAIGIRAGQDQDSVRNLLEETRSQSEEYQSQQEELRISNEELLEKSESLEKQKSLVEANNVSIMQGQLELKVKARELELSGTYKSQFLANMSHELRTPLNSMLLLSKGLMADRHGNLNDEQIEDAKIIYHGGQDLLHLINDIMDLSKVEAGMLTVNYELVEIESFSADLQRLFNPVATSKSLKFEVEITDTAPETINTDEQRLEQILKNFLSNAFKFTETGKVVLRISLHNASTGPGLNELENRDVLVFSVIDTGIGIPTDKQRLIFDAFQQLDGTSDRKHGGTGLGLSITRELTQLLGGEILVESKEGEGSNFSLYLPLSAETRSEPKRIKSSGQQHTSLAGFGLADSAVEFRPTQYINDDRNQIKEGDQTILIIEDDKGFAQTLMETVRSSGYKCLAAADGRSGLYLATEFPLCGILLDMGLPDIDGLEVIEQLKYQVRTASVPVHIISGYDREAEIIASGVAGYLHKPATREDIESALGDIGQLSLRHIRHILVAKNDQAGQEAIASLFLSSSIEFTFVRDSKDVFRHIKSTQFDCIILDLNLPDMSGFDIVKQITKNGDGVLPPIIIYTERELTDDEHVSLAGFTGSVIVKGAESPERLIDEVTMFLHSGVIKDQSWEEQEVGMLHNDDILFRNRTILLVDDDMRNVYVLSRELQQLGLNVLMAENGQVALDKLNENPNIELVLMDIMMPVMDGYEAIRRVRGIIKFAELPIIALTAKAMPEDRALSIEAGASEYLTKPINVEILKSMLRVWLFERTASGR